MLLLLFRPFLFVCVLIPIAILSLYEGDHCTLSDGTSGICAVIENCTYARDLLRTNQTPYLCGFTKILPIVCCTIPPGYKSNTSCGKYYNLNFDDDKHFVVGGKLALSKRYRHMAALGYGSKNNTQYLCGGSLISETFVLTAAHCLETSESGKVRWVRLGDLDLANDTDDAGPQDFEVKNVYGHPNFKPPSQYNDIALLELNKPAEMTDYVRPACLNTKALTLASSAIAIGWGKTSFLGDSSTHLMEVFLSYVPHEKCKEYYGITRRLENSISKESQICAGDPNPDNSTEQKDTCQGDSGGPLEEFFMFVHYIVGVTSFGKGCGFGAGVYTNVSHYIPWIEGIVWPN